MAIKIAFIILGLVIGFLQYGLTRTAAKYTTEKKNGVIGIIAIKLLFYIAAAAVVVFWVKDSIFTFGAGIATGVLLTAIADMIRNKK